MFPDYAPVMSASTQSSGEPHADDPDAVAPFAVDHILVNELPGDLGTVEAPERYTVTAVFTRRPLPQEVALLGGPDVDDALAEAGYPRVTLRAADRRLLIANTNLSELHQGLAHVIGRILDDIGSAVAATTSAQARDASELATRAAERAHRVLVEAEQIDFSPKRSFYT
jgi:hypothetical protein